MYCVTVTDIYCNQASICQLINPPDNPPYIILNLNEFTGPNCNRNISLSRSGGTPPYQYTWSNGATTQNLLDAQVGAEYCVTVTNGNTPGLGQNYCASSMCITVSPPEEILIEGDVVGTCQNTSNGSISLTISNAKAPYDFIWSTGATTQNVSGLEQGEYMVTVTDANGCEGRTDFVVRSNVVITGVTTDICSPYHQILGAIDLTVSGGQPPYSYDWDNGAVTQDLNDLGLAQPYPVTVTDLNGCYETAEFVINNNEYIYDEFLSTGYFGFEVWELAAAQTLWNQSPYQVEPYAVNCGNFAVCEDETPMFTVLTELTCTNQFNGNIIPCECDNLPTGLHELLVSCGPFGTQVAPVFQSSTTVCAEPVGNNMCVYRTYCHFYDFEKGVSFIFTDEYVALCCGLSDFDNDGVYDEDDNCVGTYNPDQNDGDGDGVGDVCDNCIDIQNADQIDDDCDGIGYACDPIINDSDGDGDGIPAGCDNCPNDFNPDQSDCDNNNLGDACDSPCFVNPDDRNIDTKTVFENVTISPNPFFDYLIVEVYSEISDIVILDIINMHGKIYHQQEFSMNGKEGIREKIIIKDLPSGVYFARFTNEKGEMEIRKLVHIN